MRDAPDYTGDEAEDFVIETPKVYEPVRSPAGSFLGSAGRGRPRKSWLECVNDDMKKFGLKKEMAHDRTVWRSAIHGNV